MRHVIRASLAAVTVTISTASAQTANDKIGQVTFPVSCNPAVQKPFECGVALLHSFWYLESGAGRAAELAGDRETAKSYYIRLVDVAVPADTQRPELAQARAFLGSK